LLIYKENQQPNKTCPLKKGKTKPAFGGLRCDLFFSVSGLLAKVLQPLAGGGVGEGAKQCEAGFQHLVCLFFRALFAENGNEGRFMVALVLSSGFAGVASAATVYNIVGYLEKQSVNRAEAFCRPYISA
jgi:hypothetical protein